MKKLLFSVALLLSLCACSKVSTTSDEFVPLDTIVCTRTVTINNETRAGTSKPVELTLATTYNVKNDHVSCFSISSPDPEIDVNSLTEMVKVKFEEDFGFPIENAELNRIVESATATPYTFSLKDCTMDCQKYDIGDGRGWCKVGCFLDYLAHVLDIFH